jgi:outer membrane protein TolC
MRRFRTAPPLVTLAVLCTLSPAGARDVWAQELPLSLSEAVTRALAQSHRLAEFEARRDQAEAVVGTTRSEGLPQVSVYGGYTRTNHIDEFVIRQPILPPQVIYPDVPDNWRTRVDLQLPLYTGGRIQALTDAARFEVQATGGDLDSVRRDLQLEVVRAYWLLLTSRDAVRVLEESLRRVDAHLADARARFETGFVAPSDVYSAEAQRSLQQAQLIEARNAAENANLVLVRHLGLSPGISIQPTDAIDRAAAPAAEAASLLDEARRARADRRALETRIAAAGSRVKAAQAGRLPQLVGVAGFDYARPNPRIFPRSGDWNDSWDLSMNASLALFDGGRVKAETAGADAAERQLRRRLAEFDSLLELEVRQRRLDVESARARVAAAGDAIRSAAESRRVLEDRYAAGVATSTEVLDAQVLLLDAELQRTRALAALRIAEAGLDHAVGR